MIVRLQLAYFVIYCYDRASAVGSTPFPAAPSHFATILVLLMIPIALVVQHSLSFSCMFKFQF